MTELNVGVSQIFFREYPCVDCTKLKCTSSCPYSVGGD